MSGRGLLGKGRKDRIQSSSVEDPLKRVRFFFKARKNHTIKRREEALIKNSRDELLMESPL